MSKTYLCDFAYETIKERIIRCQYAPNTYITEERLGEELNISRTPIRAALDALSKEHILKIIPKKGIYITDITPDQVRDVYEFRILIEPYALRTYGNGFSKQELKSLLEQFKEDTADPWALALQDNYIHTQIVNLCRNELLSSYYALMQSLDMRLRLYCSQSNTRISDSNQEHINIITAMLKDDYVTAERILLDHLQTAKNSAYDALLRI